MKSIIFAAAIFAAGSAYADSYEACTFEGPCTLKVTDEETGREVWLVTEKDVGLQSIWGEGDEFWLVSELDYALVRESIPASHRFTVPAKNPTTGELMKKGTPPKTGGNGGGLTGGAPLVTGSITVNTTVGGGNCTDCHKGSHYDIHKQVLKPQGGK